MNYTSATFTPEGTFEAIIPRLKELSSLGVTAIEVMPITSFPEIGTGPTMEFILLRCKTVTAGLMPFSAWSMPRIKISWQ